MHFASQFEYLQSWTSHVLYFIPDNLYLTRYTLSMRAVQVTIFSWQANFDSSTVTHYHFHQRYTKREKLGQFLSDESLVCLTNQTWWVYTRRLVKAPSSPPLLQSLEAAFIVMYRGCCILLLLCLPKCSIFFTPMCGEGRRGGLVLQWWQPGQIKESSKTPTTAWSVHPPCIQSLDKTIHGKEYIYK